MKFEGLRSNGNGETENTEPRGVPEPLSQQDLAGADGYPIYPPVSPTSYEVPGSVSIDPVRDDSRTTHPELVWGDEAHFHETA